MVKGGGLKCKEDPRIEHLAEALKVLSEPNRLRIICFLKHGERCVCEVEQELGISQQLTSFHLKVLRESGFLNSRREGTSFYYSIDPEFLRGINETFVEYIDHRTVGPGEQSSC
jgi:ArsR family transcriptional regulator, arsenate/arsenite/antimonite-responsive transcriptional repressor